MSASTTVRSLSRRQLVVTMGGVLLAMFLSSLDQTVVGTAMPRIISDLGGFSQYTWVTTAYLITSTVAMPVSGKLIDMYGRKPLYVAGIIIFLLGSLFCGLSNTMTAIIIWRGLQGIGAGIIMANSFTVVGDLFPPSDRGKYQGIMSGTFGLSAIIGPGLGGFLTDALSWHWVFFINIPLGVAALWVFLFPFPDIRSNESKAGRVDYPGVITLVVAVVSLMLALSMGGVRYPWLSPTIISTLAFSVAMGFLFVFIETRAAEPIIPMWLFKNRIVWVSQAAIFFTSFGTFASIIFIPLFFQGVKGLSATASGGYLTPMLLGMVGGSITAGQVLSRTNGHYRIQGIVGLTIMGAGMALLSTMRVDTSVSLALAYMVITGVGIGSTMPLYSIAVQNAVPYKVLGVATSSTSFFRSIGATVGLAVFGSIMNNRFAAEFVKELPGGIRISLSPEQLEYLSQNPQALVSDQAQAKLKEMFDSLGPQGSGILEQVTGVMRRALDTAISEVFLIGLGGVVIAFVLNFFIKEIPLSKKHPRDDVSQAPE